MTRTQTASSCQNWPLPMTTKDFQDAHKVPVRSFDPCRRPEAPDGCETEDADMSIDTGKAARFRRHDRNGFPAAGWSR
jgi:hypothetical protein